MHDHRTVELPDPPECLDQLRQLVSVHRTDIAQPQFFKKDARHKQALGRTFDFLDTAYDLAAGRQFPQRHFGKRLETVVAAARDDPVQIIRDRSHRLGDRHLVVIDHDDQVFAGRAHIVERFHGKSADQRTVSYNRHHPSVFSETLIGCLESEGGGNRGPRMAAHKRIIFRFCRRWKSRKSVAAADRCKTIPAPRQQFMCISLMSHVPQDLVFREIEHPVQRHRQFHDSQICSQVSPVLRHRLHDLLAQFPAQLRQLVRFQLFHIGRRLYMIQYFMFLHLHTSNQKKIWQFTASRQNIKIFFPFFCKTPVFFKKRSFFLFF